MNKITVIIAILVILVGGYFLFGNKDEAMITPGATQLEPDAFTQDIPSDEINKAIENNEGESVQEGAQVVGMPESEVVPQEAQPEVKEFVVTGTNFEFSLREIRVNEGDVVRIVFNNAGGLHDWSIDEFGVATKTISAGEQDVVEFIASKTGEFEYYCSVGNHRQLGMVGKLIIE